MPDFFRKEDPEPDPENFGFGGSDEDLPDEFEAAFNDPAAFEYPGTIRHAFSEAQQSSQFYPTFAMQHLYYTESGIQMMPVAGGANPAIASRPVRLHSPFTKKAVFWEVTRLCLRPVLPDPDTREKNPNEILLKMLIINDTPKLMEGGQVYLWRSAGVYVYGLFSSLKVGIDPYWAGASPCSMDQAEALKTEGYQFSKDLMICEPPEDYDANEVKEVP